MRLELTRNQKFASLWISQQDSHTPKTEQKGWQYDRRYGCHVGPGHHASAHARNAIFLWHWELRFKPSSFGGTVAELCRSLSSAFASSFAGLSAILGLTCLALAWTGSPAQLKRPWGTPEASASMVIGLRGPPAPLPVQLPVPSSCCPYHYLSYETSYDIP